MTLFSSHKHIIDYTHQRSESPQPNSDCLYNSHVIELWKYH